MPELSVLMPVRNGAPTIGGSVRSTLAAMPSDSELLVMDDGSTDDTATILGDVADRRLSVLRHERSQGVAASLNELLTASDSVYVARMDADDIVLPWRFRYQRDGLRRAGADAAFTTIAEIGTRPLPLSPHVPIGIDPRTFSVLLLLTNPVSHPTLFARRTAIEEVGGYRAVPAEDYDLWLRLAVARRPLARLAVPTLLYRRHPEQVTSSESWRRASWTDEQVQEAYGSLAHALTGTRLTRLVSLAVDPRDEEAIESELRLTERSIEDAARTLPALQRARVRRLLRRRLTWVRARRGGAAR